MKKKILKRLFYICLCFSLSTSVNAALVTANYSVQEIVYTYVAPGAIDSYGIDINSFGPLTSVDVSFTYDNDSSNATSLYIPPSSTQHNYDFQGAPYSASITIDNVHTLNTEWSAISITNDVTSPPDDGIPQVWIDQGFPSTLSGPADVLWMGGYSNDFTYWPDINGLLFSIDFIDLDGTMFSSDSAIPEFAPDINQIDFAILQISQYENDILQFEAYGIVANNISAIPVPAAAWLFGSGLIGLIGVARRKARV